MRVLIINLVMVFWGLASLLVTFDSKAQNCNQANLTVEGVYFYDDQGRPFDENVDIEIGQVVNGKIYVVFGGSSDNAYSLLFTYDQVRSTGITYHSLCLFQGTNVIKGSPQYVTDFSMVWGEVVEFKNIFMRWSTNLVDACPTVEGSNAQCYTNPEGFKVEPQFSTLPIRWLYVESNKVSDSEVALEWATAKEQQSSHFEIERSVDGVDYFKTIGKVDALGWSEEIKVYNFKDSQIPFGGGRMYYRIKEVDLDGSVEYSTVMMEEMPDRPRLPFSWKAYPNPVSDGKLTLNHVGFGDEAASMVNIKVISSSASLTSDFQVSQGEVDLSELVKKLPKGLFILQVSTFKQVQFIKLLKK